MEGREATAPIKCVMRRPNGIMPWKCYREGGHLGTIILDEVKETSVAAFLPNDVLTSYNVIILD